MRLERLEISGFKSFPDRADLAFDRGVTAIVGPNGCGKSNVVDAITWVLGEQSARSLRGERMEDVIFNGSDARKPTSAAEVRLRMSGVGAQVVRRAAQRREDVGPAANAPGEGEASPEQFDLPETDTRAVELSRRLYRSGESEYLIDGEVCRLRDIQDLLMDAGLGVKGYAVIEQGKIGQILTSKPTDRRQLIEEAAGVTKYKSRRRTAELKLEAAQQNLTRVDDIIFEVEKQRLALRRQAGKARRYKRLREELRRWEKVLFARRHRSLSQAIEATRSRLDESRAREREALERLSAFEQQVDDIRRRLSQAEHEAADARERVHARELEKGRREQQLHSEREQVALVAQTIADLGLEIDALERRIDPARHDIDSRREAAHRAASDRDDAARVLAEHEEAHTDRHRHLSLLDGELEAARGRVFAVQATAATLRHVIERAGEARDRIAAELARLDAESADLEQERTRLEATRVTDLSSLSEARTAIATTRSAFDLRRAELVASRGQREAMLQELRTREREHAAGVARLRSLEELDAAREGFSEAARVLLSGAESGVPHQGSVADYLEADPAYERAVEACLGDLLQAVIVADHDAAQRALDFVRERTLGRCLLLVAQPGGAAARPEPPSPDVRPLDSVVRIEGPCEEAIREVVASAWIADTVDAARRAARQTMFPVATPAGDVFRGSRVVTAGGRAETRGILATRREIKQLRERLGADQASLEQLTVEAAVLDAGIAGAEHVLATLSADLHEHEKVALGHELHEARTVEELERVGRKLELVAIERRRAEEERRMLEAREDEARASLVALDTEQQGVDLALGDVQRRLSDAREAAAEQASRLGEAKAQHAALGERASAFAAEVARLEEALAELAQRIAARSDELGRSRQRHTDLEASILDTSHRLEEDAVALGELVGHVRACDEQVKALQADEERQQAETRDARLVLERARASVAQYEVTLATAESDIVHLASSCEEILETSIADVVSEVDEMERQGQVTPDASVIYGEEPEVDEEVADRAPEATEAASQALRSAAQPLTAEEAIAELKAKIDRLGPVNMMAIEQYDELDERHRFLSTQRQDLVDSIAATGEAIKRIEKTTRERFREAFAAINRYFEETFTTLFGGGRAGLVLLDEDDLLESGIDIIAQPPGKRLQNVQLLSGGEKALTAMALMFAIFRYRPSPFCLLDEIDAPLDDANIGRFIEMLRGMQQQTQFILVTHSRKTMEIADRLYGVTMEEPGVSKLISIKLN